MKSRLLFGLLAMTLILAFASASFAQINVQIFSSPSTAESANKRTAQTADPTSTGAGVTVSGGVIANAELTTTVLELSYGAIITSTCSTAAGVNSGANCTQATVPAGDPIRIVAATGLFANVTIQTILYTKGLIDIVLPECKQTAENGVANCATTTPSGSFRLVGVRNDVNGKTAPLTVSASLNSISGSTVGSAGSGTGNNYILTTNSATTISALNAPLAALSAATTTATVLTNGTSVLNCAVGTTACGTIKITEGYASSWRSTNWPGNATTAGSTSGNDWITLKVSGLPTGQTIAVTTVTGTSAGLGLIPVGPGTQSFTGTNPTVSYAITGSPGLTTTESIVFQFTLGALGTVSTPGTVSVSAQMGQIGSTALDSNGVPTTANGYPVYADANVVGPVVIENIVPAQTNMLIPFAVFGGGYDTGIAIANTTLDPYGTANGGATPTSGTLTFSFYPQLATGGIGTASSLTTSATIRPVTGLSSDGTLAAGGLYTVLLSSLLPLATPPITGSFEGYIFVTCNFLDAHGVFYPTNFTGFTAGSLMLNLPSTLSTPRTGFEALNN